MTKKDEREMLRYIDNLVQIKHIWLIFIFDETTYEMT